MAPGEFIELLLPAAQACHRAAGIPASFTLAQAALESSWGARAPGFNLFGVKPGPAWKGATVLVDTHEFVSGVRTPVKCAFRAYGNWSACIEDHADFFRQNPRYKKCFLEGTGEGWAHAVAAAGYATDPAYADKLIAIMRGRNLVRYDASSRMPA
ncbi:mannosyl-glycoprotein endo-beta-N-acetylglucosamidase [Pseudoduganella eburnea]|uniref:Mannosyl-glycoprotein endo-beta-N-acetylglucosamidase n=1 Tax=Massilia eburnea TaxID=1776165 RepID=A0A6L6QII3_9BURK|nr:glucosaminidase domain-containing protein [Massilia eburnea]MTW11443.1 mannosyl-glycoprotein endo-beta-N-acetylglucosamidase [Massilia eburnea]